MRVVQLIDSLRVGGAQSLLLTFASEASKAGMEIIIISLRKKQDSPITSALEKIGANITYLPAPSLANPKRIWKLWKILKGLHADILHTHLTYANILGTMLGMVLRIPVVVSIHTVAGISRTRKARSILEQFLLRYARHIISVGENVATSYQRRFPGKVSILPNAVQILKPLPDQERMSLRKTLTREPGDTLLVAVGRLNRAKGFTDLLAAFDIIHKRYPHTKLIVAGDGDMREQLQADTLSRKLKDDVHWLGVRNDVPQLLLASDIYVSASHWEGLSIALLEAMAAGLASVATDVGDASKVITPETGLVVPPHAPDQLAEAIETLLKDMERTHRMGIAARERIRIEYNSNAWFNRLTQVYNIMLKQSE